MSVPGRPPETATVVVVGSGAREHALAWKLSLSPQVGRVILAPGNDGAEALLRAELPERVRLERWEFQPDQKEGYFNFALRCRGEGVDLLVVGPDQALANGLVDVLEKGGISAFGPTRAGAELEWSKAFAKDVMKSAGVPTAKFETFSEFSAAEKFLTSVEWGSGWVVKADGLALGKGVRVCNTREEAIRAARELLGSSGSLVIEERLEGEEISWIAFCDGEHAVMFEPARDYKRIGDGDAGPNTGGMGAVSPVPGYEDLWDEVHEKAFLRVLAEMKRRGREFRGVLYAGLMVSGKPGSRRWSVLEFNARFGDPETQVLLPRMEGDLFSWCLGSAEGILPRSVKRVPATPGAAVYVVAAAAGYPDSPQKGAKIEGFPWRETWMEPAGFVAGVKKESNQWLTSGGRVLGYLGRGGSIEEARRQAYLKSETCGFVGRQVRKDIAGQIQEGIS